MPMTRITVNSNGPLRVEAEFEIVDHTGKVFGMISFVTNIRIKD